MSLARKNSILSKTINVDHSANGDTLFIPHSGIVNISGILTATSGNFSSQTVFASGTAAAPGISIVGDTDTGLCQISSVGTNSLSISTSGVERVRFASNGDVQINTGRTISGGTGGALFGNNGINNDFVSTGRAAALSAGWATLRVNQVAAYVGLRLVGDTSQTASYMEVENSSGTNLFTINSAGNVGIGTSSPNAKLEIQGSSGVYTRLGTTSSSFYVVHNGTTDTFLYTQEASPLRIGTSATERLRITSGGNLEIKSNAGNISTLFTYNENGGELVHYDDTQTAATLLDQCANSTRLLELINGSDLILGLGGSNSTGSIRFMRAGYNEGMRIDSAGNVGIGSTSPSVKLDVYGADAAISVGTSSYGRFQTSGGNAIGYMYGSFAALGDGIHLTYNHYHNAAGTLVISNSAGFTSRITAGYGAVMFATSSAANVAPTERMRITSDGSVGIGTTSPATRLHVAGTSSTFNGLLLTTTAAGGGAYASIDIGTYYGTWTNAPPASLRFIDDGNFSTHITFRTKDSGSAFNNDTERMRITSGGNVGIGTTTVSYRLHVVANASATNNITTYLNNTGGTRSRLAFQDTAVSYAPDMGSVGNSLTFDTVGVERVRIGNNGRTQFFAANEKFGIQLNNGSTGNGPFIGSDGADIFCISTAGGAERVRVDAGGNVGIGVTPVASTTSSLQVISDITLYGASRGFLGNLYFQSGWKYAGTGHGWGWIEGSGSVDFARTSSSGTAGNTATLNTAIRINSNSEVLIGTTTDNGDYKLQVNSQIYATNATIATSDARFKTRVETLNDATTVIEALRPVSFDFLPHTERNFATERQVGLIAQEAQAALAGTDYADSVVAQCGDHLGLAYEKLVPVLIKALQESNARIAALEQRINA